MCGIAGFLSNSQDDSEAILTAMNDCMSHRGPDDSGCWMDVEAGVGLGQRRLAILDLSTLGHQPMFSASSRYAIVFNGEVYNFSALKNELTPLGHSFKGGSDTEVMLAAIEQWGLAAAVSRFIGMFAFALWDNQEAKLSLVRDRLGIKPLYYGAFNGSLVFGSELKALRAYPGFESELDRDALALYFRHSYVPAPWTIYRAARKLLPGHILTVSRGDNLDLASLSSTPYWSMETVWRRGIENPFSGSVEEAADELERLLTDAIRLRMIADVPLGALLSGGIDSSTVTALMQKVSDRPVKTFSIGFHEKYYNEAAHAKEVARHLGTDHTELYVTPRDLQDVVPLIPRYWDEPFADSSQIPTYLVFKLARPHVTVALSGDGGDELFAGYRRYFWASKWDLIQRVPRFLRAGFGRVAGALPLEFWKLFGPVGPKLRWRSDLLGERDFPSFFLNLVSHFKQPGELVPGAREHPTPLAANHDPVIRSDIHKHMQYMDLISYLPDDILTKVDRASMAVSLEARVPILDHRVVEFAARLSTCHNVKAGQGKQVLRRILHRYVPHELVARPKMGFGVPIEHWMRHELRDWAEGLIDERKLVDQGHLDPGTVRKIWKQYLNGSNAWSYHLWDILMFQSWLDAQS